VCVCVALVVVIFALCVGWWNEEQAANVMSVDGVEETSTKEKVSMESTSNDRPTL
jgi:hypothetical protein